MTHNRTSISNYASEMADLTFENYIEGEGAYAVADQFGKDIPVWYVDETLNDLEKTKEIINNIYLEILTCLLGNPAYLKECEDENGNLEYIGDIQEFAIGCTDKYLEVSYKDYQDAQESSVCLINKVLILDVTYLGHNYEVQYDFDRKINVLVTPEYGSVDDMGGELYVAFCDYVHENIEKAMAEDN